MKNHNRFIGQTGEIIAADYLLKKGFTLLKRNFTSKYGEIDIICEKNNCYYFFEVKTRLSYEHIKPFESVNYLKIKKILVTVNYFFYKNQKYSSDRDQKLKIISITLNKNFYAALCLAQDINKIDYKSIREVEDYTVDIKNVYA